jgi:hypothetical protein
MTTNGIIALCIIYGFLIIFVGLYLEYKSRKYVLGRVQNKIDIESSYYFDLLITTNHVTRKQVIKRVEVDVAVYNLFKLQDLFPVK